MVSVVSMGSMGSLVIVLTVVEAVVMEMVVEGGDADPVGGVRAGLGDLLSGFWVVVSCLMGLLDVGVALEAEVGGTEDTRLERGVATAGDVED